MTRLLAGAMLLAVGFWIGWIWAPPKTMPLPAVFAEMVIDGRPQCYVPVGAIVHGDTAKPFCVN